MSFLQSDKTVKNVEEIIYLIRRDMGTAEYFGFTQKEIDYFRRVREFLERYKNDK